MSDIAELARDTVEQVADGCIIFSAREENAEVSSFFYLVNDSQGPRIQAHQLHLQLWGHIFQAPPETKRSKFLVARSAADGSLSHLRSIWEQHFPGPPAKVLISHDQAEKRVRKRIFKSSRMVVQLRTELLNSIPLRETAVGKHYAKVLKAHIKSLKSGQKQGGKWWKQAEDPDGSIHEREIELRHWKKCKLPLRCKGCLLVEERSQ